jgi:hypothetical protein
MNEYYAVIPKNVNHKSEKFIPLKLFNQNTVTASVFGQKLLKNNFLMLYIKKPSLKPQDFNKHYLIRISVDHDQNDHALKRMSSETLHGGNIRINLEEEDKYIKLGLEVPLSIRVEAQIMPNGQEMRISDIEAINNHKPGIKKSTGEKKQKIKHKATVKNKSPAKKPKVVHKAAVKNKSPAKKHKVVRKTAVKNKSPAKKHKVIRKTAVKNKSPAKKHKVVRKTAVKNKSPAKKPKVVHKTAAKNKKAVKKRKI